MFEDNDGGPSFAAANTNTGDYFNGAGFEEFIQQLPEIETINLEPSPAWSRAVQNMPDIVVDEKILKSDSGRCAV